jgi:hypothetical protein
MLSPLPRRSVCAYCVTQFAQSCQPSPIWQSGRPAHCPFAILAAVLGLGPVLVLIVVIEIYCRIQNWRRLRAAEDADANLDKLRPTVDVIHKLRSRAQQAQDAGEPALGADLRLAIATLERLDREAALARRPAPGGLAPEPIQPI